MVYFGYDNHIIVYSVDKGHSILIAIQGRYWKILGKCSRCGECCISRCEKVIKEIIDGKVQYRCGIQHRKPADCSLYPCTPLIKDHFKATPSCTFSFQEITKLQFIDELEKVI